MKKSIFNTCEVNDAIECEAFFSENEKYLKEKLPNNPNPNDLCNKYKNYNQYVCTVNALNAFLNGNAERFKECINKLDVKPNFKIIVDFTGVPYNPFAGLGSQSFGGAVEKTFLDVVRTYRHTQNVMFA